MHFVFNKVFPKIVPLLDNAENHNVLLLVHGKSGYMNSPQCYIVLKFPVLLESSREIFPQCISLLISSYMFRLNCHHQRVYTCIAETYSDKMSSC